MEYATPAVPTDYKMITIQQGPVPRNPPTDLTHAEVAIWIFVALAIFMAPTWIAARGRRLSIGVINVLLGWTGIGWCIALYMAVRSQEQVK